MALKDLIALTEKSFSKKFKDSETKFVTADLELPPTGIIVDNPMLEYLLDRRFLAWGRFYLTYGKKGCSKTSLFFDLAKLFQQNGGDVIWLETEQAADLNYAASQGVDLSRVVIQHPQSLEEALSLAEGYVRNMPQAYPNNDTPLLICFDSYAGVCPEYELQDKLMFGETKVGEHARILSGFYRKMDNQIASEKVVYLAINQLKDKIGGMQGFGSSEDNSQEALLGGDAQRFHSTCQWRLARTADMTAPNEYGAEDKVGSRHTIIPKRNKLGKEGNSRKVEFDLYIKGGIDWYSPLVRKLEKEYSGIITKSGGWCMWKIADTEIPVDEKMRESELAVAIKNSPKAKDYIRKVFGIPDLPTPEEVTEVETENKKKRNKRAAKLVEEAVVPLQVTKLI